MESHFLLLHLPAPFVWSPSRDLGVSSSQQVGQGSPGAAAGEDKGESGGQRIPKEGEGSPAGEGETKCINPSACYTWVYFGGTCPRWVSAILTILYL